MRNKTKLEPNLVEVELWLTLVIFVQIRYAATIITSALPEVPPADQVPRHLWAGIHEEHQQARQQWKTYDY